MPPTPLFARFQRIRWLQPSVIALVIGNLAPLVAVFLFHWDVFSLLFLFWLENVIVGVLNVVKMLFAGTGLNDLPKYGSVVMWALKLLLIPFFCVHYGAFTLIHGAFIFALFDQGAHHHFGLPGLSSIFQIIQENHLQIPFAGLLASHLISFGWDYLWRGEYHRTNPVDLMTQPYRRVVVMHLTIIFGGFLMMALHSPEMGLVFLVVVKTTIDLVYHQKEREKFSTNNAHGGAPVTYAPTPSLQDALLPAIQARVGQKIPIQAILVLGSFFLFFLSFTGFIGYQFLSVFFDHSRPVAKPVPADTGPSVWRPRLIAVPFPETPAAGKFRGEDFSIIHASYGTSKLSLGSGSGTNSRSLVITLNLDSNALPGRAYDLSSSGTTGLPEIKMHWHENGAPKTTTRVFGGGYALKLKFGARTKNKIPGWIYLCLPDPEKSYVAGTFIVTIKKDKETATPVDTNN